MSKKEKLKRTSLEELASEVGVDYQTVVIKSELIDKIIKHCEKKKISQHQLARMVPGLTQDRVSKIFNGQIGHMTIDKLIVILVALDYKVEVKTKAKTRRAA